MESSRAHYTLLHQIWWKLAQQYWHNYACRHTDRLNIAKHPKTLSRHQCSQNGRKKMSTGFFVSYGIYRSGKTQFARIYMKCSLKYTIPYTNILLDKLSTETSCHKNAFFSAFWKKMVILVKPSSIQCKINQEWNKLETNVFFSDKIESLLFHLRYFIFSES